MGSTAALATRTDQMTRNRPRRRRFGLVPVVIAGALLLASCMNADQQSAFDKINASRTGMSTSSLKHDETAQKKAQAWAEHLAQINKLEHSNLASGMDDQWKRLGENVGYSSSSISKVHDQFMASSGHRANILDGRFTHVGTGVAKANGRVFVVQMFVQR